MIFGKLVRAIRKHLSQVSWFAIIAMVVMHAAISWLLLTLAGETHLVSYDAFLYYYVVTTSTVGFGDLSPNSHFGKLVVALVQIPLGLALFGALLGKLGQSVSKVMRQVMTGEKDFSHYDDHIIIFGWHPIRTAKIISHILGDNKRENRVILLCVAEEMEHPFLDNPTVEFAKLSSFTDDQELARIAVAHADKVIVDGDNDDQTFTCALKLSNLIAEDCHISVYFNDETKVEMLNQYTNNVECNSSTTAELLVRSMQDPGSSRLHQEMMSTLHGDTQFSSPVPALAANMNFGALFTYFKASHNATILAVAEDRIGQNMHLNPDNDFIVEPGFIIHYVAKERLVSSEINWSEIRGEV